MADYKESRNEKVKELNQRWYGISPKNAANAFSTHFTHTTLHSLFCLRSTNVMNYID